MAKPGSLRFSYFILFMCLLTTGMGQSLVFAILPPLGRQLGLQEIQVGLIITCSSLTFFLISPFWGRRCDEMGRKSVILIGQLGYTFGTLFFASAFLVGLKGIVTGLPLYILIVVSRMFQASLYSASAPGATAFVADVTSNDERAAGMGRLGAARNLGMILGPGVSGLLAVVSLLLPLYFAATLTLIVAGLIWLFLENPPRVESVQEEFFKLSYFDRRYVSYMIVGVVMFTAFAVINQTIGFYYQDRFTLDGKATAQAVGVGMMASAIMSIIAQGALVQGLHWEPLRLIRAGTPVMLVAFLMLLFGNNLPVLIGAMAVLGLGFGLAGPGFTAGASLTVGPDEQGALAGLTSACPSSGFIIGPLIGTGLYQLNPIYPFLFISLLFIPLIIFIYRIKPPPNLLTHI
jgi:MFS family permease